MNTSTPTRPARVSPWIGVRPYGAADADRFFGRSTETARVVELWQCHRLTILHGESGVGKTSLLQAAVRPHLVASGANVLPIGAAAGHPGLPGPVVGALNPVSFAVLASWQPDEPAVRVLNASIVEFLQRRERFGRSRSEPTLVAVDHVHRAAPGSPDEPGLVRFLEELAEALGETPSAHLLLSTRTSDLGVLRHLTESLPAAVTARYALGPLTRDSAIEAVVRPLAAWGVSLADGAAGHLVDSVSAASAAVRPGPGDPAPVTEPVPLQIVATALWEARAENDMVITPRMLPDAEPALAAYCARALDTITTDHGLPTCEVGTWLRRAFITPDGGERLVRPVARPPEMTESLIRDVEDRYLLTRVDRNGEPHLRLRYPWLTTVLRRLSDVQLPARQRDPAECLRSARLAYAAGDLDLAMRHALSAMRLSRPEHQHIQAQAQSLLGCIAHLGGRHEAAEEHYRTAIGFFEVLQRLPEAGRLLAAIGELKLALGDKAGALEELSAAAQCAPDDPSVQIGLAHAFWYVERPQAAINVLDRVLRTDGNAEARRWRGEIHVDLDHAEQALRDLDRLGRRAPPSARAARSLALCMVTGGQTGPDDLEEIVDAAPRNGPVLLRAARTRALCGDADRAGELAARALRATDPPLAPLQSRQARELLRDG
ncbi:hypothetical protein F8568_039575 [Actinomadura sp. LD22]|uniref:Novel STAND NTPase 1 domain-containing protein n=1 Tax=Actinomadura physcomitrii TaxID=2650748 RepID=A0A6I4ML54_9ACTN|nr:tetratricopeptide repeat protein [Actinomadura physcomitrii]MWA06343.1 hypothetical protein [Actinomadura physcomitrii]